MGKFSGSRVRAAGALAAVAVLLSGCGAPVAAVLAVTACKLPATAERIPACRALANAPDVPAASAGGPVQARADRFLSDDLEVAVTGVAQKRNAPTARDSLILRTLQPGERLSGRWVQGADGESRWFRTTDGGYVWEGNLAVPGSISPDGVEGVRVGASLAGVRGKLASEGRYGSRVPDWDAAACEIYPTSDGRADVMVESGRVTRVEANDRRLMTAEGAFVGATEAQLRAAYGARLKRQANPYAGEDFLVWTGPERGLLFNVYEGKVTEIRAGGPAIRYVEGCL